MASLKYVTTLGTGFQRTSISNGGSGYTSGATSIVVADGTVFPATGDFWVGVGDSDPPDFIKKVTARSGNTLTVPAGVAAGTDGNKADGVTVQWVLPPEGLDQLRADIVASGALVLLEQHAASTSASLDFTTCFTSTYDEYVVEILNLVPATNAVNIMLRVSTNGGSSYDSGSNYAWMGYRASPAGATFAGSANTTSIGLDSSGAQTNSATTGGMNGSVKVFNPLGGAAYTRFIGSLSIEDGSGNFGAIIMLSGFYKSTTAVNAFQVLASSGNITSGTIRVYGIAK